jgi:dienelactone hydrolase
MRTAGVFAHGAAAGPPGLAVSVKPVVIASPGRGDDLQVRVSAPVTGEGLPVVVFSHGFGWSMEAYGPLADYWAAHGLVIVQPTHLDSRRLGLAPGDPRTPDIWRIRVSDLTRVLDSLGHIEASVPGLRGRVDRGQIAAAGHSWGAQTASTLLGARVLDADGKPGEDMSDDRVKAGVLLSVTGTGTGLAPFAVEHFPFMRPDFTAMTTPSLVVAGDHDDSPLSSRGPDWFTDAYRLSHSAQHLLTLFGGEHSLGGIAGDGLAETTDENPARVALIQQLTTAYLRTALGVDPAALAAASPAAAPGAGPAGRLDSR